MVLICHVILQDHMIKESMTFMNRDTWRNVTILSSLEAMVIVVVVIYAVLQEYVINRSCDFMGKILSKYNIILPILMAIDIVWVEM